MPSIAPSGVGSGQNDVYTNDVPGCDHRGLTHDARAADLLDLAGAVGDPPVPRQELDAVIPSFAISIVYEKNQ